MNALEQKIWEDFHSIEHKLLKTEQRLQDIRGIPTVKQQIRADADGLRRLLYTARIAIPTMKERIELPEAMTK